MENTVAGCTQAQEKESANEPFIVDNDPIILDDEPIDVDMGISGGIKALTKEIIGESLYIDANGVSHPHKVSVSPPVFTLQEDGAVKETSCVDALMLSGFPNYELQNKSVDMISDDDDGSETSYALVSPSTHERIEVPLKDLAPECSSVGHTIVASQRWNYEW